MKRRTANGKAIDMEGLAAKNELTPAVGNTSVNARGDIIDSEGNIVERREHVVKKHYDVQTDNEPQRNGAEIHADE